MIVIVISTGSVTSEQAMHFWQFATSLSALWVMQMAISTIAANRMYAHGDITHLHELVAMWSQLPCCQAAGYVGDREPRQGALGVLTGSHCSLLCLHSPLQLASTMHCENEDVTLCMCG